MAAENEKDAEDALKELKGKELCGRPLNVCKYILTDLLSIAPIWP